MFTEFADLKKKIPGMKSETERFADCRGMAGREKNTDGTVGKESEKAQQGSL